MASSSLPAWARLAAALTTVLLLLVAACQAATNETQRLVQGSLQDPEGKTVSLFWRDVLEVKQGVSAYRLEVSGTIRVAGQPRPVLDVRKARSTTKSVVGLPSFTHFMPSTSLAVNIKTPVRGCWKRSSSDTVDTRYCSDMNLQLTWNPTGKINDAYEMLTDNRYIYDIVYDDQANSTYFDQTKSSQYASTNRAQLVVTQAGRNAPWYNSDVPCQLTGAYCDFEIYQSTSRSTP
jgi:hypothetical protein